MKLYQTACGIEFRRGIRSIATDQSGEMAEAKNGSVAELVEFFRIALRSEVNCQHVYEDSPLDPYQIGGLL